MFLLEELLVSISAHLLADLLLSTAHTSPFARTDTPYEDHLFTNWPRHTLVRGQLVYSEGELTKEKPGWGKFVKRGKSLMGKEIRVGEIEKDVRRVASWLEV